MAGRGLWVLVCCLVVAINGRVINQEQTDSQQDTANSGRLHRNGSSYVVDLLMPNVQPQEPDTYLCVPFRVGETPLFVTGFEPHANMSIAHHMLIYGCSEPGSTQGPWNCGEMLSSHGGYDLAPVCQSGPKVIYAWAMGAPDLTLPEGVAFNVGGQSDIPWVVLQVHYKDVTSFLPPESKTDSSGVSLHFTEEPQPKLAGVYLMGTSGRISPQSTVYMETACKFDDPIEIHPFGFRVHAHKHGDVVSGYRVRDGQWEEIGRQSPQVEQMFYPVTHPGMVIQPGDILAARCTMTNDEDRTIMIGPTQHDEMCNFYIMYYVDGHTLMSEDTCFTAGPPTWYWSRLKSIHVENSPDTASLVPGQDHVIKATETMEMENDNSDAEEIIDELLEMIRNEENEKFLEFRNELEQEMAGEPEAEPLGYQDERGYGHAVW